MKSMKKEDPSFTMVAGDFVMGHWGPTGKSITITKERKKRGFTFIGKITIIKQGGKKPSESIA